MTGQYNNIITTTIFILVLMTLYFLYIKPLLYGSDPISLLMGGLINKNEKAQDVKNFEEKYGAVSPVFPSSGYEETFAYVGKNYINNTLVIDNLQKSYRCPGSNHYINFNKFIRHNNQLLESFAPSKQTDSYLLSWEKRKIGDIVYILIKDRPYSDSSDVNSIYWVTDRFLFSIYNSGCNLKIDDLIKMAESLIN